MAIRKIIVDLLCLLAVGAVIEILPHLVDPFERGFNCNDESISYPWKESSTVESDPMHIVGIAVPIVVMVFGEFTWRWDLAGNSPLEIRDLTIPSWLTSACSKIGAFLFGAAVNEIMTEVTKYQIGRLRPFFLTLCVPNVDCSRPENQHVYIQNFNCTGEFANPKRLRDARKSFPSGHSSFSSYVAVYLVLYLHLRLRSRGSKLLGHVLQFVVVLVGWFTAMSRISDYKHHWSDVLAGLTLGTTMALLTTHFVVDFFKKTRRAEELDKNERGALQPGRHMG